MDSGDMHPPGYAGNRTDADLDAVLAAAEERLLDAIRRSLDLDAGLAQIIGDPPCENAGGNYGPGAGGDLAGTGPGPSELAAADQIIDAGHAIHQDAGPLRELVVRPNNEDGVIGYRRSDDKPEVDEHRTRRASRSNRHRGSSPASRLTVPAVGRIVIGVAAAVAVAVIAFVLGPPRPVAVEPGPPVTITQTPHGSAAITVPAVLLFAFNSSHLPPAADTFLKAVVLWARSQHLAVSLIGYASPDGGTAAYNRALSLQRAMAVRDRLIALGLPAAQMTHVTGVGTGGQLSNVCRTEGQLAAARCAQLRRVVIVLSPAKGNQ